MSVLDTYKGYFLDTPRTEQDVHGPGRRPTLPRGELLVPLTEGPQTVRTAIQYVLDNRDGPLLPIDEATIIDALNRRAGDLLTHLRDQRTADYVALLLEMRDAGQGQTDEDALSYIAGHMFEALKSE